MGKIPVMLGVNPHGAGLGVTGTVSAALLQVGCVETGLVSLGSEDSKILGTFCGCVFSSANRADACLGSAPCHSHWEVIPIPSPAFLQPPLLRFFSKQFGLKSLEQPQSWFKGVWGCF